MRKLGEVLLTWTWNRVCDFVCFSIKLLVLTYAISLFPWKSERRIKAWAQATFSLMATALTTTVIWLLMKGSWVKTGLKYIWYTLLKRDAISYLYRINWAKSPDEIWEYTAKEKLIQSDSFASWLSSLGGGDAGAKALQIAVLLFCTLVMVTVIIAFVLNVTSFCKGAYRLAKAAKASMEKNERFDEKEALEAEQLYRQSSAIHKKSSSSARKNGGRPKK